MIVWGIIATFLTYVSFFGKPESRPSGKFLLIAFALASIVLYVNGVNPNEVDR